LRLNKNLGHWDWEELAKFDQSLLEDVGFTSLELETSEEDINLEGEGAVNFDDFKEIDLLFAKEDPLYEELYGHYKGKNTVDKTNSLLKYLGKK
jgi:hypothetical protein